MYVSSLTIKKLRCFREAEIEFQFPERKTPRKFTNSADKTPLKFPHINLLLGNNGSGKSSVLKALALSTLSPVLERSSGLVLYSMVRKTGQPTNGKIEDTEIIADLILHEQDLQGFSRKKHLSLEIKSRIKRLGSIIIKR